MLIETVFDHLNFNFLMTVAGIMLALYALIQAWRYKTKKEFSLLSWDNEKLLKKDDLKVDNLRLLFNGRDIEQIHIIRIYFQNEGNTVVKQHDIHNSFKIKFDKPVEILTTNFYSTNKFNKIVWSQISDVEIEFSSDFFEPEDILKIEIQYSNSERISGQIIGKVIGGNDFQRRFGDDSFKYQAYASAKYSSDLNLVLIIFLLTLAVEIIILKEFLGITSIFGLMEEMVANYKSMTISKNLIILTLIGLILMLPAFSMAKLTLWAVKPYWLKMKEVKDWVKK